MSATTVRPTPPTVMKSDSTSITIQWNGTSIVSAVRKQAAAVQAGLKNKDTKDMFATYTSLEKKLLFPILGIVWISVKLYQKCAFTF